MEMFKAKETMENLSCEDWNADNVPTFDKEAYLKWCIENVKDPHIT